MKTARLWALLAALLLLTSCGRWVEPSPNDESSLSRMALSITEVKLIPSELPSWGDEYGQGVAIDGDTALVGMPGKDGRGGAAYVFVYNGTTWVEQAKLTALDGTPGDYFGASVSLSGDTAIIGARYEGAAYVFVRSGSSWTQQAKLTTSDGVSSGQEFGFIVAIDGDTAVVSALWDGFGSAYVFVRSGTTWTQQAKFTLPEYEPSEARFGRDVAVSGDTVLIGASHKTDAGPRSGAAYVFVRSGTTWALQAKLTPADAAAYEYFGHQLSLDGNTALVGAADDDNIQGTDAGAAYVFVRTGTTWTEQAKLTASDGASYESFGVDVEVRGDTALIGLVKDNDSAPQAGSAYVFTRSGTMWTEEGKFFASDAASSDMFGLPLSLSDNVAIVGGRWVYGAGAAYIYHLISDTTPPVITPTIIGTLGTNGWYVSDVTVSWVVTDDESEVSSSSGCDPVTIATDTSSTELTCTATSEGGTSSASVTIKRDVAAPLVTVTGVSDGATYTLGSVPIAGCATQDTLSGVAVPASLSITGDNVHGVGSFTATCNGALDNASNATSASVSYKVIYNFAGFFNPVDNPPILNAVKAGRAIPVKFSLGGDQGLDILAMGSPSSVRVTCSTGSVIDAIEETVTAGNSSLTYNMATGQYSYVWKTNSAWTNTCRQFILTLNDDTVHVATFQFK